MTDGHAGNDPGVADPVEKVEELTDEAQRGRSERTPWLVLGGVHMVIIPVVAVLIAVLLVVYYAAK